MGWRFERPLRPIHLRVGLFLLCSLLVAGCNLRLPGSSAGPTAWIDAPLDGSQLPLAPVAIVLHAASPNGIQKLEVTLNGQALADLTPGDPQAHLVSQQTNWSPDGPGTYIVEARAVDGSGQAGPYAQAKINIAESKATPTSTPTLTSTPTVVPDTATPQPSPTASPTFTVTPSLTSPAIGLASISLSDHQVFWGGSCQPNSFTVQISVTDPSQVKDAIFFFRVENASTHEESGWSQGNAMNPQGSGVYQLGLTGRNLAGSTGYAQAIVHYQIALQTAAGDIVRSQVFNDLTLSQCGSGPAPTATGIIIVPPPGGIHIITPTVPVIQ